MKKIFFDTEFTGLYKDSQLISIGLISEDGDTFYAELTDYDKNKVSNWIYNNVILNLKFQNLTEKNLLINKSKKNYEILCDKKTLKEHLTMWLQSFGEELEIWSDCLAYDWVLFCDIYEEAFKIPKCVYYIPFDICTLFKVKNIDPDISREEFAEIQSDSKKHNSLFDAISIKKCYEKLSSL